jgi:hypothetical protein
MPLTAEQHARLEDDPYRVLPHRDVSRDYEHIPCGTMLTRRDIVEENWCPHCVGYINKAAKRRANAEWK